MDYCTKLLTLQVAYGFLKSTNSRRMTMNDIEAPPQADPSAELKRLQTEVSILKTANSRLRARIDTQELVLECVVDKLREKL